MSALQTVSQFVESIEGVNKIILTKQRKIRHLNKFPNHKILIRKYFSNDTIESFLIFTIITCFIINFL